MKLHVPDGYASEEVEKREKIKLGFYPEAELGELIKILNRIATILKKDEMPVVQFPRKGLLHEKLSDEQRWQLNFILSPNYALVNAQQRKLLLEKTKIKECGERMVDFDKLCQRHGISAFFSKRPFHEACGSMSNRDRIWWLRESVALSLAKVFYALGDVGFQEHVEDCWRPADVQEGLLLRRLMDIAREFLDWDRGKVRKVAMSLTASVPGLAGHMAGAAVDWRLQAKDGKFLRLGNEYAETGAVSSLDFPYLTKDEWWTRNIFMGSMLMGGFKLLYTEDWHASMNDRGMGADEKAPPQEAIYGPIVDIDYTNGKIDPYTPEDIDKWFMTDDEMMMLIANARIKNEKGEWAYSYAELRRLLRNWREKRSKRSKKRQK